MNIKCASFSHPFNAELVKSAKHVCRNALQKWLSLDLVLYIFFAHSKCLLNSPALRDVCFYAKSSARSAAFPTAQEMIRK